MFASPGDRGLLTDSQQELKFLNEEGVVVLYIESKERVGFGEGPAPDNDLRAPFGEEIKRGEVLKYPHRIFGTQDCHRARETDLLRPCGGGRQKDDGRRIEKLWPVMFPDAEDIQT
jgi:hypothetical protein